MNAKRLEQLINMRKEDPKDPFLIYAIAMEYAKVQEQDKALEHYELLVQEHPNYVGTYYHYAKLCEQLNKKEQAEQLYKQGMSVARNIGDHHAFSELQSGFNSFNGLGEDDDY